MRHVVFGLSQRVFNFSEKTHMISFTKLICLAPKEYVSESDKKKIVNSQNGIAAQPAFDLGKLDRNDFTHALLFHGYAEERVRLIHRRFSVRDDDELRVRRQLM